MKIIGPRAVAADTGFKKDTTYSAMMAVAKQMEPPAPRAVITSPSDRKLVEYCCGPDSLLGRQTGEQSGYAVVRLTAEQDMTTLSGMEYAKKEIESTPKGQYIHLWSSMPCAAGSPWQHMNVHRHPSALIKIQKDLETHEVLMDNFMELAELVIQRGGEVTIEWPTRCSLWEA